MDGGELVASLSSSSILFCSPHCSSHCSLRAKIPDFDHRPISIAIFLIDCLAISAMISPKSNLHPFHVRFFLFLHISFGILLGRDLSSSDSDKASLISFFFFSAVSIKWYAASLTTLVVALN